MRCGTAAASPRSKTTSRRRAPSRTPCGRRKPTRQGIARIGEHHPSSASTSTTPFAPAPTARMCRIPAPRRVDVMTSTAFHRGHQGRPGAAGRRGGRCGARGRRTRPGLRDGARRGHGRRQEPAARPGAGRGGAAPAAGRGCARRAGERSLTSTDKAAQARAGRARRGRRASCRADAGRRTAGGSAGEARVHLRRGRHHSVRHPGVMARCGECRCSRRDEPEAEYRGGGERRGRMRSITPTCTGRTRRTASR